MALALFSGRSGDVLVQLHVGSFESKIKVPVSVFCFEAIDDLIAEVEGRRGIILQIPVQLDGRIP
jgi:hypothetical protein